MNTSIPDSTKPVVTAPVGVSAAEASHVPLDNASDDARDDINFKIVLSGKQFIGLAAVASQWVWFFLVVFSGLTLLPAPPTLYIEPLFREACFIAMTVGFLLLLLVEPKLRHVRIVHIVSLAALLTTPLICASILFVHSPQDVNLPVELTAWVLFGFSASLFLYEISFFLESLTMRTTVFVLGIAVTFGAVIYLLMLNVGAPFSFIVICALPCVCVVALWSSGSFGLVSQRASMTGGIHPFKHLAASLRIQPAQPFYGMLFGLTIGIGIHLSILESGYFPTWMALSFCVAGPVLIVIAALPRKVNIETLQWVLLALAVAGTLLVVVGNSLMTVICCAFLAFCFSFFEQLHTLSLVELMREQADIGSSSFLAGKLVFFGGVAIGWGASLVVLNTESLGTLSSTVAFVLVAIIVVFAMAYIGRPSNRVRSELVDLELSDESTETRLEKACAALATEAKLSPRQVEVFSLLAKGRNAPYIEDKLVISYHTAKAHIYRIYQKLDVHSQQELINMVEERVLADQNKG